VVVRGTGSIMLRPSTFYGADRSISPLVPGGVSERFRRGLTSPLSLQLFLVPASSGATVPNASFGVLRRTSPSVCIRSNFLKCLFQRRKRNVCFVTRFHFLPTSTAVARYHPVRAAIDRGLADTLGGRPVSESSVQDAAPPAPRSLRHGNILTWGVSLCRSHPVSSLLGRPWMRP